jgi:moderate conductance mechanosensitive channel
LFSLLVIEPENWRSVLRGWRADGLVFVQHALPKILLIVVISAVLIRVLRLVTRELASLRTRHLPTGMRARQVDTLASILYSVGTAGILFVAAMEVLPMLGLNLGPLLASAGVVGLAVGFGAQTLVHDVINGSFILLEDQFDLGDTIRIAGVKGTVEQMSLRRTVLRDDDGTLHTVPNSQILIVSNMTRDWAQVALKVAVAYDEPSDRIVALLKQVGEDVRHDPAFANDIVSDVDVPGLERVTSDEAEYLLLIKTLPSKQYAVRRELQRRVKETFTQNKIRTAGPGRLYVLDPGAKAS